MPSLETLVLHHTLPLVVTLPMTNRRTKTIPRLKYIDIIATALQCTRLLKNFTFSPIASAKFEVSSRLDGFDLDFMDLAKTLSDFAKEDGLL
jgi:hypothetical protein